MVHKLKKGLSRAALQNRDGSHVKGPPTSWASLGSGGVSLHPSELPMNPILGRVEEKKDGGIDDP